MLLSNSISIRANYIQVVSQVQYSFIIDVFAAVDCDVWPSVRMDDESAPEQLRDDAHLQFSAPDVASFNESYVVVEFFLSLEYALIVRLVGPEVLHNLIPVLEVILLGAFQEKTESPE